MTTNSRKQGLLSSIQEMVMLRSISIIVLGVATVAVTPLDAQLIRRFSPGVQQRQSYNQAYQTVQTGAGQSSANCTCSQNQLPQQNRVASQSAIQGAVPTPVANRYNQAQAQQPQRFGVYYNPRTNQTYLRPIQSVARTVQNSNLNPVNLRATRQQAQTAAPPVARTVQSQAQQAPVVLNAPAPTPVAVPLVSPAVTAPKIDPAMNAPVGTLTSQPRNAVAPTPAVQAPVATPKSTEETSSNTFSILESPDAPKLAPTIVDGNPGDVQENETGEVLEIDLNEPKSDDE